MSARSPWRSCRGCGRRILWARSPAGARMPLERCVAYVFADGSPDDAPAAELPAAKRVSGESWISHFVTCPRRELFTRRAATAARRPEEP